LALPMILYFHRLSISGVTANLIVTPMLTLAVPTGLLAVATGWAWPVWLTGALVSAAGRIAHWHARWDPGWRVPDPPLWVAATLIAALLALALWRKRWLLVPALALIALAVWHPFEPRSVKGALELTMLDVGQGEALLIGFPSGQWMMVDGGGIPVFGNRPASTRMDIGEDVVSPYLLTRGIRRIDYAVSTHQHDDHAAGLAAVIENFRPRELWTGATPPSDAWSTLLRAAARHSVRIVPLHRGHRQTIAGVAIETLSPSLEYQPRSTAANNDSLVLRLTYGAHSFLLTGDIERAGEHAMLDGLTPVSVLKVAHHGSKTSTTGVFLDAVQPAFALISAGKDNMFRHPHTEVLQRLSARHIAAFRTDDWGLVTIRSDGRKLALQSNRWRTAD
ncbi:MAG: ComEC family DNA internalization-related competence protein, partial [Bryobacterales bacterium]|nr:ComEC family DNA internalization-related competence protein [Bryobacterales bacterium]